jgi:hypothetical protein
VESTLGKGTIFTVEIPISPASEKQETKQQQIAV